MNRLFVFVVILTLASQAQTFKGNVQVKGNTTTSGNHYVALTWTQSSDPSVASNNVYRGTVSGGPYSLIYSSASPVTGYSDNSVASGTTYYYTVTAVNSSSIESGYSNEAAAVIP